MRAGTYAAAFAQPMNGKPEDLGKGNVQLLFGSRSFLPECKLNDPKQKPSYACYFCSNINF